MVRLTTNEHLQIDGIKLKKKKKSFVMTMFHDKREMKIKFGASKINTISIDTTKEESNY